MSMEQAYALQNIGYWSGYYDQDMSLKIQTVFQTAHPVFGRLAPSTDEALNAGIAISQRLTGDK